MFPVISKTFASRFLLIQYAHIVFLYLCVQIAGANQTCEDLEIYSFLGKMTISLTHYIPAYYKLALPTHCHFNHIRDNNQ
jgi:hypothetical protein